MSKLILIDGNSLINRAFYALPPLNNDEGVPTQAVFGFTTMLVKLITTQKPEKIAVAFDMKAPTFRHKMYDQYKATRKGMPDELAIQLPLLKELLQAMNIAIYEKEGYEADDIIGTLSKRNFNGKTIIVTGDRDSLQLIDSNISVMLTKRGITEVENITNENIMEKFGMTPSQVIDFKALAGDGSDNIPGVAGVGDKTALSLLSKYRTLQGIYDNIDEINGALHNKLCANRDMAFLSEKLATIDTAVPIEELDMTYDFPFSEEVKRLFQSMKFRSLFIKENLFKENLIATENNSEEKVEKFDIIEIKTIDTLKEILNKTDTDISFAFINGEVHFSIDGHNDYKIKIKDNLLDEGIELTSILQQFLPYFIDENIKKIIFDIKAIKKALKINQINNYFDVRLAQYIVDMTIDYSGLSAMTQYYGIENEAYGCALFKMKNILEAELDKMNMHRLYYDIELPLTEVLYKMEQVGCRIDVMKLDSLGKIYSDQIEELTKKIFDQAGFEFNINSPKQLAEALFDKLKIPYPAGKAKKSTNAEVLERLSDYPIVRDIMDYRAIAKLKSTYIDGLKKMVTTDGIVHTEFNQMMTTTGRLSSKEPNLQNIPVREERGRRLREVFISGPGCTLVSADYSQIELRLLANFSGDEIMLNSYRNGEDIHAATASEIFDVKLSEVTSKMRREAKTVNFGIIYGISDFGLAQNLGVSSAKAHIYKVKYFEKFPRVKEYLDGLIKTAKERGYAETLMSRKRKIPEINSKQYVTRSFGERAAMNMPLQGGAADIIKIAMIKVDKALEGMKSKLILQIHDELIVDADDTEIQKVKEILKTNMENCIDLEVPLEVNISTGKRWSEC